MKTRTTMIAMGMAAGVLLMLGMFGCHWGPTFQNCLQSSDCPGSQQCVSYSCRPFDTCQSDNDCKAPRQCINSLCQTPSVDKGCTKDTDCTNGRICQNKQCVSACSKDSDCGSGSICEQARCQTGGCTSSNDCATGEVCTSKRCKPKSSGPTFPDKGWAVVHPIDTSGFYGHLIGGCYWDDGSFEMASKRAYPEGALNRSYTNLKQTTDGIKWECTSCASAETWPRHEHNELVDMEITGFLCDGKRGLLYGTFYDKEGTGTSGAFVKESGGQWKKSSTELGLLYGNRDAFVPRPIGGEWYLNNNGGDIIAGIQWDATASFDLAQSYFFLSIPSTPQKRPVLTDLDINHGRGLVVGYNNDTLRGADPIGPLAYFHMSGKVQKTKDRNAAYKEWTAASPPCTNCLLYSGAMIGTSTALVGAADWDATKRTSTGFALYKTTDLGKSWKKVASTTKPGNMSDILSFDKDRIFAVMGYENPTTPDTYEGVLWESQDGGKTFQEVPASTLGGYRLGNGGTLMPPLRKLMLSPDKKNVYLLGHGGVLRWRP